MSDTQTSTTSITADTLAALQAALPFVEGIAALFVPNGKAVLAGLTVTQISNLISGVIGEVPEVQSFIASVKAAADGSPAPTAAQFAAIDTDQEMASAQLAAADAKIIAAAGG
jgi:hypothetical protein